MGIDRFSILGVSGGGPYAAACAYKIPHRLDTVPKIAEKKKNAPPGQAAKRQVSLPMKRKNSNEM